MKSTPPATCIRNSRGNEHGLLTDEDVARAR